ncbi:MAG: glutathione S-transferase N-terminal domain-containing protein [Pseudomonadota bacterium]
MVKATNDGGDNPEISLYTAPTPNGRKVSIALEEMALPYDVITLSFAKHEQKSPSFLKISPNGRIPAIVDRRDGEHAVFESGAILIYLAERSGQFLARDTKQRSETLQWLMYQMSAVGPMFGQTFSFMNMAKENPEAQKRFFAESERICEVLDRRLAQTEFVAGDYSIADIALYPWLKVAPAIGLQTSQFAHIDRWMASIGQRPAVARGLNVPKSYSEEERQRNLAASITTE